MYNTVEIDVDDMSLCMQSFKNFKTSEPPIKIAYELPDDHPRLGDFWNIVGPIVTANHLIELNTPRLGFTAAEQARVFYPTCRLFNFSWRHSYGWECQNCISC